MGVLDADFRRLLSAVISVLISGNLRANGVSEMPKMKTKRGAAKRFRLTKKGKIKRKKAFKSHILTKKSAKRKRGLKKSGLIHKADVKRIKRLIPYG